ncbi:hypothetical protein ACFLSV_02710 [Bacteroidota bacterium]
MQKRLKIKFLTTISLIILSIILLFIYSKVKKDEDENSTLVSYTSEQLKKLTSAEIDTILTDFGIKNEWITDLSRKDTVKTQNPKEDKQSSTGKLWFHKNVTIPVDLSAPDLIVEISDFLNAIKLSTNINEDPKTRNLSMDIYFSSDTKKETLAKINFIYSDKIKRDAADICIILNNLHNLTEKELNIVLKSPEKFALVLPTHIEETDIQSVIFDSKKEYLLLLDIGSDEDIKADFRSDMRLEDWKSKVRSFCYEYDKAGGVLLNVRSDQFKFETDVNEEFRKYRNNAYRDTILIKFNTDEDGEKKINALFSDIKKRAKNGYRSLIYLVDFSYNDFQNYSRKLFELEKKGYKLITFSKVIKRRVRGGEEVDQEEDKQE